MTIIMIIIQEVAHLSNTAILYYNNWDDAMNCINDLPDGWTFKATESVKWDVLAD